MEPKILSRDVNTCSFSHYSCTFETWFLRFLLQCLHSRWPQRGHLKLVLTMIHIPQQTSHSLKRWGGSSHLEITDLLGQSRTCQSRCCPTNSCLWWLCWDLSCALWGGENTPLPVLYCLIISQLLMCLSSHHSDTELEVRNWGTKSHVRFWKDYEWIDTLSPF